VGRAVGVGVGEAGGLLCALATPHTSATSATMMKKCLLIIAKSISAL
jgi:hypothetical protein